MTGDRKIKVLLVDDEAALLEVSKLMLEQQHGLEVVAVESPAEALSFLKENEPDAVVSDYQMPEMDGIGLLKAIRVERPNLPFILFTGKGREEVAIEALNNGATFYLQKGGGPRSLYLELANKIELAVQRSRLEKMIKDSGVRNRLYIDNLPDGFFVVDRKGRIQRVNPAACAMLGYTDKELLAKGMDDLLIPPTDGTWRAVDWNDPSAPPFRAECKVATQAGRTIDVILNVVRLPDGRSIAFLTNITNLKQTERSLLEKTQELTQYFSASLDLLSLADKEGRFVKLNPEWEKVLGYPVQELLGRQYIEFVHPDDLEATKEATRRLYADDALTDFVNRYRHKNGSYRWLEWRSFRAADGTYGVARDVTDRMEAENDLKRQVAYNRAVMDHAKALILTMDTEGRILAFNRFCEAVSGYTEQEVLGMYVWDALLPSEEVEGVKAAFGSIRYKPLDYYENHWVRKDGTLRRLAWSAAPVPAPDGTVSAIIGIALDITKMVENEKAVRQALAELKDRSEQIQSQSEEIQAQNEELRMQSEELQANMDRMTRLTQQSMESEAKLQAFIQQSFEGIVIFDPKGKVVAHNSRMAEMIEREGEDLTGENSWDLACSLFPSSKRNPNTLAILKEQITNSLNKGMGPARPYVFETEMETASGHRRIIQQALFPIKTSAGNLMGGVYNDITERRQAEEGLKQTKRKLELLSQVIRHDIINQIMVLSGNEELLRSAKNADKAARAMDNMHTAIENIETILRFGKEYELVGVESPDWFDVAAILEEAKKEHPGLDVVIDPSLLGVRIYADPMISRVFNNLIDNASRHGSGATKVEATLLEGPDSSTIVVQDNGMGVPQSYKDKLFQLGVGSNHGYGLYLSREVLAITGITIEERGEPGMGARFEITVPSARFTTAP